MQANGESEAAENLFDLSQLLLEALDLSILRWVGTVHDGRQELVNYELPMDFRCGSFTGGSPTSHQDGFCEVLAVLKTVVSSLLLY